MANDTDDFDQPPTFTVESTEADTVNGRVRMVPTLHSWATRVDEQADALMAYYLTSEYSQSAIYHGNVTSLPYHLQEYGNQPSRLKERMQVYLTDYFNRYFDTVDVQVSIPVDNNDTEGYYDLSIRVSVVRNNTRYDIGRQISISRNRIQRIQNV